LWFFLGFVFFCLRQKKSIKIIEVQFLFLLSVIKEKRSIILIGDTMGFYIFKLILTASLIVCISEIAKLSDKLGGLIAALPLTTLLVISWMYIDGVPDQKISNHMIYTFFFVLPTLPMFLFFPFLLKKIGFWLTVGLCIVLTSLLLTIMNQLLKRFDMVLF
jgi:hypothetical protein